MDPVAPEGTPFETASPLSGLRDDPRPAPPLPDIFRKVPESLLVEWDDEVADTGLVAAHRREIGAHLYKAMADSHVLELKCWRYYWNVKGPISHGLKAMLREQALGQRELLDGLGHRIRALSFEVPSSLLDYLELSEIRERGMGGKNAGLMLKDLAAGHALLVRNLKAAVELLERAGDRATLDVFARHIGFHEGSMRLLLSCLQAEEPPPEGLPS